MSMKIDGSLGEGGGQILRTALSVSAIAGKLVEIVNIRAKRTKPGLRPQHLTCVQALTKITGAEVKGAEIGSTSLSFSPKTIIPGHHEFDIGTAGSTTLLLQCLLPPLLMAGEESALTLKGGTDVPFAPPSFFAEKIFCSALGKMGAEVSVKCVKHGFYPEGGGLLYCKAKPARKLKPLKLEEKGNPLALKATALSANLPDHVAERQKALLEKKIEGLQVEVMNVKAQSPGNVVFIEAENENVSNGFSALGEVAKPAETVAEEALSALKAFVNSNSCVEKHLADQLLLYCALAEGESVLGAEKISLHAATNLQVLEKMLGTKAKVEGNNLYITP